MNTLGLHPVYKPKDPSRRFKGIVIVVALHVIIGWGIVSGSAKNALVSSKKPIEAVVIQEVIIPPAPLPPPPPPLPKEIVKPRVLKVEAPPPPFVPPAEVAPPVVSAAPVIQAVQAPPQTPVVIAPPPPPPPPPSQAPVATGPKRSSIGLACPTQVAPEMPRRALREGTEGVVKAQALIKDGVVKEVTILSGPRVFHAPVKDAMMQYKCVTDLDEVMATQEFVFKIE